MRIDILTALPRLLDSWFNESILERAQKKGLVEIKVHDLREHSTDKPHRLDDYAFGGGAGRSCRCVVVSSMGWRRVVRC